MSPQEFSVLHSVSVTLTYVFLVVALVTYGTGSGFDFQSYKRLDRADLALLLAGSLCSVGASLSLMYLFQSGSASAVMCVVQPLSILLTFALGYFFFSDTMNRHKAVGAVVICVGVAVFSQSTEAPVRSA